MSNEQGLILKNQSLEVPHHISIGFNYYQNKPTLFICDANFGVVAYTDIAQFKLALCKMLTFYIEIHKIQRPHFMTKKLCCEDLLLPTITSSNEWQTKFSAIGQNDKLPTAALATQLCMPGWAKVVLLHLTKYENTNINLWEKTNCLIKIKSWLLQENVKSQYAQDISRQKHARDLLAQIEQYLTFSSRINPPVVQSHLVSGVRK